MASVWFVLLIFTINISPYLAVIPKDYDAEFWTDKKNEELISLFFEKDGNERKMHEAWRRDPTNSKQKHNPQMKYQVRRLIKLGLIQADEKILDKWGPFRKRFLPHQEMELMKLWHNLYEGRGNQFMITLHEAWMREHPNDHGNFTAEVLVRKANDLLRKKFTIPHEHTGRGDIVLESRTRDERDRLARMRRDINIIPIPTIPSPNRELQQFEAGSSSQFPHSTSTQNHTDSHQEVLELFPEHPGI